MDVSTRLSKKDGKKPYKGRVLCHPLLERRERVKRRERPDVQQHHNFCTFFGGLKSGQEVVPPFWAPKFHFLEICQTLYV